jgi:catechol 2,3-dioxygenase-like lactoylglutathione lyase family enzyme
MSITQIQVVSIPVSDQDRAKSFYTDTLGFTLMADAPMGPDMRWVQLSPPAGGTSITLVTWFEGMPAGSVSGLVLGCADIQATVDELAGRGLSLTPIESQSWGTFSTFQDPDGNGWVLAETPPEATDVP